MDNEKLTRWCNTLPELEGVVLPLVYPNGRNVDISGYSGMTKERKLLERMPYNKVFYDPATFFEKEWKDYQLKQ